MAPVVDCSVNPIEIAPIETTDTGCGSAIGGFTVSASGGEAPYEFTANSQTNADGAFQGFDAGTFSVKATDSRGCTAELSVTIQNQSGVNLDNLETVESGCGSSAGSIQVSASGGEEPYSYSLNDGVSQASSTFSGLSNGKYTIMVNDQNGCESTSSVDILSGISYNNTVKNIIQTNCAIPGCHNGSVSPNLSTFSSIKSNANIIESRTANRSMPSGRTLSQTQIDAIGCWVSDGAIDN
ncbi:MAG: hypothetical protein ACJA2C_002128 [Marinoscillum sp.]|jgi:hypothetical protein